MKFSIYFFIVTIFIKNCVGVVDGQYNSRFTPDEALNYVVKLIREVIKKGDPQLGLPILDPFEFETFDFSQPGTLFSANISISNGKLTGLADFQLIQLKFSKTDLFIELNLRIPVLEFSADHYELDGVLNEAVPIRGRGRMYFKVDNITSWGKLYLKQSDDGKSILLRGTEDAGFHIDHIMSITEFDGNIDDILTAMVEDLLAEYLNRFNGFFVTKFNEKLIERLNPILDRLDTWQLIDAIPIMT